MNIQIEAMVVGNKVITYNEKETMERKTFQLVTILSDEGDIFSIPLRKEFTFTESMKGIKKLTLSMYPDQKFRPQLSVEHIE